MERQLLVCRIWEPPSRRENNEGPFLLSLSPLDALPQGKAAPEGYQRWRDHGLEDPGASGTRSREVYVWDSLSRAPGLVESRGSAKTDSAAT